MVKGISFGDCTVDFGDIFVAAGNTVLLTSVGIADYVLRTTETTETFLNTAVYEIVGTPITQSVPRPGTDLLVGLASLLIAWRATRPRIGSGPRLLYRAKQRPFASSIPLSPTTTTLPDTTRLAAETAPARTRSSAQPSLRQAANAPIW